MIRKGWFSNLEILEIHKKTNKQHNNTVPDTSKNNLTEMNRQLLKMEKPHNQTTHNEVSLMKDYYMKKSKSRKFKENYEH